MRKADIALYEAKGTGKGRLCVFEAALDELVFRKRSIERDLREAIGTGHQLRLEYQPLFAVDGATLIGAEALVRWEHPKHGRVPPAEFIPLAEERGLIHDLGAWVLREACETAKALDLPWIAVNVSAVQFRAEGFVDLVLDLLQELEFSGERLQLEITEGLLLDATEAVASVLSKLRFAGVCIALDDFGTGYSSLRYLHRYKVDKIKIDRSFVMDLGASESTDAIVRAMLDLGRALHLSVAAEGVETPGQWQRLAALGAPELQGYLFSKPITADALRTMLARENTAGPARKTA
jgi:EAL domain-containing protein (putative c-di-GMP-specific phosphodiesterase class I)